MIAEYGDMETTTGSAARLADGTLIPVDLMVYAQPQAKDGLVEGAPLLAVEVTSAASRERDLGEKKELYARHGIPCYWVVELGDYDVTMHIFELGVDGYDERAVLGWGETVQLSEPFKIEIEPDELFRGLPPWRGPIEGVEMAQDNGPDLPTADDPFEVDAFSRRWPTGAEKIELQDGVPVFYGRWDERDVAIAERAYPGRVVRLDQKPGRPGTMTVLPADPTAEIRARAIRIDVSGGDS
ncbi:hypothetical protein GCM10010468_68420 [Actinocorallia longicatena]|uniref:Putative restriction endonuclease domain-containing protein n=2 Tax=Actinocorallia longicatena TaxID=111803 RepID=A0ABP6QJ74_9ACTN